MNGAAKWIVGVLALYAVILGLLFTEMSGKADESALQSIERDVREIRGDVKDLLRYVGGGR